MNKIERAIYDTKLHINALERDALVISTELKAFKKQLDTLETIQWDKTIPHDEKTLIREKLIELYQNQLADISIMSKIELGDDVIEEIGQLKNELYEQTR